MALRILWEASQNIHDIGCFSIMADECTDIAVECTVRGDSIGSILENYVLNQLWEECLETSVDPDVKGRIIGVRTQMSQYNLLLGLKMCERVWKITNNLSKTLQKQSLSAVELAELTVKTLKG